MQRVAQSVSALMREIATASPDVVVKVASGKLAKRNAPKAYPLLKSSAVDVGRDCGKLDPLVRLSSDLRNVLSAPELLFPCLYRVPGKAKLFKAKSIDEYVRLTRRQLRENKLRLVLRPTASADVFYIPKRDQARLREVWNGRASTQAALPPPMPPALANPAALIGIECSSDRTVWLSARDGAVFFDQLEEPSDLRQNFGRPVVSVADLLGIPGTTLADDVLTAEEVNGLIIDRLVGVLVECVTPVSNFSRWVSAGPALLHNCTC